MIQELEETKKAAPLFEGWQETMIWSCLQGVMGKIYVDSQERPVSAAAVLGDFCFLAGKPDRAFIEDENIVGDGCGSGVRRLSEEDGVPQTDGECRPSAADGRCLSLCGLRKKNSDQSGQSRDNGGFRIIVPGDERWAELIEECFGEKVERHVRYAIKKEPDVFDREKLQKIVDALPDGYELKMIDGELFERCRAADWSKSGETDWSRDWVAQYRDYDTYRRYGLGAVILKDGEPVSGASSYTGYIGGIEVQIDTREDYRRRGLALICGAKLILECLDRGWYPSWDAQNRWSAALAEKLGYHFDREYTVYGAAGKERRAD